tara:strand:- start:459 stop:743 length:285 start_codon:yes stop_codon:yes gene_type:complete
MAKKYNLLNPEERTAYWTEFVKKRLIGKTIVDVEYLTNSECKDLDWYCRPVAFKLNDGSWVYSQKDDEGNDGGALYYHQEDDCTVFPVLGREDG